MLDFYFFNIFFKEFLILAFIVFVIPGIIFKFLIKQYHSIGLGKSIFEIFIAKITCILIGITLGFIPDYIIFIILKIIGVGTYNIKIASTYVFTIGTSITYLFFYYRFILSNCYSMIGDEESRKKFVYKFVAISEIISIIAGAFIYKSITNTIF
ncbi:hypothetical protein DLH72_00420 [Candidatus Gracilibacteria bacterium]|nr:MAG: hypothetical protein DLH72_00420 [Candidatus Gracilibacteria bacterium]